MISYINHTIIVSITKFYYIKFPISNPNRLTVGLGNALKLVLLLNGVRVAASLGGVDQFVGQALGNGLDVPEGGLAGAVAQEPDGLVDATERGDVDGLTADGTWWNNIVKMRTCTKKINLNEKIFILFDF